MSFLRDVIGVFKKKAQRKLPCTPFVADANNTLCMFFDTHWIQSAMSKDDPDKLELGYTRTMMGFLLLNSAPESIAMIGLGGGSLAKYCAKHLPEATITTVEINAQVIALRDKFMVPIDSEKFKVLHANGADYILSSCDNVDVLLVDGFDDHGHPPRLGSAGFYDNCYAKLHDGGVLVVNLLSSDLKFGTYVSRIRDSFQDQVVVVDAEDDENKIVFAYKGMNFPIPKETILEKTFRLELQHPIQFRDTAHKIIKRLKRTTSLSEWAVLFKS
jgi:spermidine synthase